ncbi:MAG: hypothetical protein Q8R38_01660 [Candidatus Omnitrophota bacterium]|nr:hypothetical protein [Candidatus Omnitrophota bacterium]
MIFRLHRSSGLTLIELTLVTLLLLVIVGLSVPIFKKTFQNLSAKDTSYNISKLINYAQEMAVLERKNFKIIFDFSKGKYQLFELITQAKEPLYTKAQSRFGKMLGIPQGLTLRGDRKEMIFYPDGHCDDMKIYVMSKRSGFSIIVKRFGNKVEIKEVNIE